jgi:hypothetical protein
VAGAGGSHAAGERASFGRDGTVVGVRWRRTALLAAAAALAVAPTDGMLTAAPNQSQPQSTSIVDFLTRPGDQVVTVPDGTYSAGLVSAPHPATDGQFGGWLILQAETQHGVTVTGDLTLDPNTSRVLFVGFRFENARVLVQGEEIAFWYTDHVYPDVDWYAAGRPVPHQFRMWHPATTIWLLGSDFHDGVATPIRMSGVSDIYLRGVAVYDINEPDGSDPEDQVHLDVIGLTGGATSNVSVGQSYFRGGRLTHSTDHGDVVGITYRHVWYTEAFGAAFQYHATNGFRIVGGVRENVRSWGHLGEVPRDRIDSVEGDRVPVGSRPDRVDVTDEGVIIDAPPDGAIDPATSWRQRHPYDSWPEYFGVEGAATN